MLPLYLTFFTIQSINAVVVPYLQVMLRNSGYSYEMIGFLFSLYEAFGIIGPLVLGALADKSGKYRWVLLGCVATCAAGFSLVGLSSTLPLTILGLFCSAFCIRSMFPLQDTIATDFLHGDAGKYTRMRAFGTFGYICFNLVYAATSFPHADSNRSILSAILLGCGIFAVSTFFLPKAVSQRASGKLEAEESPARQPWFDRAFLVGLAAIGFSRISMTAVSSFLSLYMVEQLHMDQVSLMTAIGAISEMAMMLFAGYLLQKRHVQPITLIMCSAIGMFVRLMIYALFPSPAGVLCGQLLHSLGFGALQPAAVIFVARRVRKNHRGVGMSMYISLATGVPSVIGSTLGGMLLARFGYAWMFMGLSLFSLVSVVICLGFRPLLTQPPLETA